MAIGLLAITAAPAIAAVSFDASSGDLSASAEFEIVGNDLQVILTNTSGADVLEQKHVLTAAFFDMAGDPDLTPKSAELYGGSTVVNVRGKGDGTDGDGKTVGGEWAYRDVSGTSIPHGYGISSSGVGDIFGVPDLFPGNNLQGPESPDGIQYGITSAGDDITTGNKAVTGGTRKNRISLIQNSVIFLLSGLPDNFTLAGITNVSFNYGTDLNTIPPNGGVIPEPASLAVWGALAGVGLVAGCRRRRKKQKATA